MSGEPGTRTVTRQDIVDACAAGRFTIHSVDHIDTGIELLTGIAAGEADENGDWPADTINGRVARRLAAYASKMRALSRRDDQDEAEEKP